MIASRRTLQKNAGLSTCSAILTAIDDEGYSNDGDFFRNFVSSDVISVVYHSGGYYISRYLLDICCGLFCDLHLDFIKIISQTW